MNALQNLITNVSTFLLGPFGVSLATVAIAFSAAFIVTTWVGA